MSTNEGAQRSTKFSIKSFYGSRDKNSHGNKRRIDWGTRLEESERQLKIKPVIKPYRSRLDAPCTLWQTFYRQQEAFDFARLSSQDLKVFAFESPTLAESGKRMYLVASYDQFWHYYSQLTPDQRHHYEVIPEGAVCKLYFDLEFSKDVNPHCDGNSMVQVFIQFVIKKVADVFNVACSETDVLQLDSSSSSKFSQHLIFNLNNVAFRDNTHIGSFVRDILSALWKVTDEHNRNGYQDTAGHCEVGANHNEQPHDDTVQHISSQRGMNNEIPEETLSNNDVEEDGGSVCGCLTCVECLKPLVVSDKDGKQTLFCDTGVYTKNRNFRLYLSSKIGKKRPLVVAAENKFVPEIQTTVKTSLEKQRSLFIDSLISNVKFSESLRILSHTTDGNRKEANTNTSLNGANIYLRSPKEGTTTGSYSYGESPYPEIDKHVQSHVINRGGVQGHIRRWLYFSDGETIIYDITGNRWCENIGRPHKSNNVMIVVKVKEGLYYQKCHDPECRRVDFKSENYPLPPDVVPRDALYNDSGFGDEVEGDISDCDLLKAANYFESTETATELTLITESTMTSEEISDDDLLKAVDEFESRTSHQSSFLGIAQKMVPQGKIEVKNMKDIGDTVRCVEKLSATEDCGSSDVTDRDLLCAVEKLESTNVTTATSNIPHCSGVDSFTRKNKKTKYS